MTRLIGATWAAVHGPAAPAAFAVQVLEWGFDGVMPAPAPRPVDWAAVRKAGVDLPFTLGATLRMAAITATHDRPDRGLASRSAGQRLSARAAVTAALEHARALGLDSVLFEPGAVTFVGDPGPLDLADPTLPWTKDLAAAQVARREALVEPALDSVCRELYHLSKSFPDMTLCLGPSRTVDGLGTPDALAAIFEDLPKARLAYWHDAAVAACRAERLGEDQGLWPERFVHRLAGMTLADWGDGELHRAPGAGQVDFPLLATYIRREPRPMPLVVELDPGVPSDEIPSVQAFLAKFGL